MKFNFSTFGQDLLKALSVATVVAEAAEPVVDLTQPGIAQVYNLSAEQASKLLEAYLGQQQQSPAPSETETAVADTAPGETETPIADPAPSDSPAASGQPLAVE